MTLDRMLSVGTSLSKRMSLLSKLSKSLSIVIISASGKKHDTCNAARFNATSEGSIRVIFLTVCIMPLLRIKSA